MKEVPTNGNRRGAGAKMSGDRSAYYQAYHEAHREERRQKGRLYYQLHKEEINQRSREYRRANPEKTRAQRAQYYAKNREALSAKRRAHHLANQDHNRAYATKRNYGLTPEQVEAMAFKQGGKCKLCGLPMVRPAGGRKTAANEKWHIDHDHKTGLVRGLIHGKCNRGLGAFNDDPKKLMQAVVYICTHLGINTEELQQSETHIPAEDEAKACPYRPDGGYVRPILKEEK